MNNIDKISRDAKIISDSIKDTASANLMSARQSGTVDLTEEQLGRVLNVLNVSVDQAYQKVLPHFQNTIKKYF